MKKVVTGIIFNMENEKVLVIKRKQDEEIHGGVWAFPGGKMEAGEHEEETLRRELKEEVGLDLISISRKISDYVYDRADGTKTEGVCFLVKTKDFNVAKGKDIEEIRWVSAEELQSLTHIPGILDETLKVLYPDLLRKKK